MLIEKSKIKIIFRDIVPMKYQVPLKYYYNRFRSYLEPEMEILQYLVKNNSHVIDIGGNRGVYTYHLWKLGCKVEVFEPNPVCLNVLQPWVEGKSNIHVHAVGLSNSEGSANLHIPIDNNGVEHDASASIENVEFELSRDQSISLQTLDSYRFEGVSFIKIDVEGHEYNVLQGAASLLASSRPSLLVEIEQRHNGRPIYEVFQTILDFGYRGYFMDIDSLISLEKFDVSTNQSLENFGNSNHEYINNFLFLHQDRLADGEYDELFNEIGLK